MAEKKPDAAAAEAPAAEAPKKSGPMKTVLLVVGVLALEAGTVGVTMMLAGGPQQAQGKDLVADEAAAELEKIVEMQVAMSRFPNLRTGRNLLYDTEVYITLRKREQETAKKVVDASKAQISQEFASIVRKADPSWFQEATLTTLRRQFKAALDEKIGKDAKGEPIVQDVLITKCIPMPGF